MITGDYWMIKYYLNRMQAKVVKSTRTSIISNMELDEQNSILALVVRQLSTSSSKYVYSVQTYNPADLTLLKSTKIYETYNEEKHYLAISRNWIAAHSRYYIHLYDKMKLTEIKKWPHNLETVNGIAFDRGSRYLGVVGSGIAIWDLSQGNRQVKIDNINEMSWFNFLQFSRVGNRLIIAKINQLAVYEYFPNSGMFERISFAGNSSIPSGAYINSIDSSPISNNEIVVGLSIADPQYYSVSAQIFFKKTTKSQPNAQTNIKIARYMPDGHGFVSADLKGFGLWSDDTNQLYYLNEPIIGNAYPNSNGQYLYNYSWEELRKVQIFSKCSNYKSSQCPCPAGQIWRGSSLSCIQLSCSQIIGSTGNYTANSCVCEKNYNFDAVTGKCLLNCSFYNQAFRSGKDPVNCQCKFPYAWNAGPPPSCAFSCANYQNTVPATTTPTTTPSTSTCNCTSGMIWNPQYLQCECPTIYQQLVQNKCQCLQGYFRNSTTQQCQINCSTQSIQYSQGTNKTPTTCMCIQNFYFDIQKSGSYGCKKNCSELNNTVAGIDYFSNFCVCEQNFQWSGYTCVIDCGKASETGKFGVNGQSCECPVNYYWRQEIYECARNCSLQPYTVPNSGTNKYCKCIKNFQWDQTLNKCEINCKGIAEATFYRISDNQCECRQGYDWIKNTYKCELNCSKVYDGKEKTENNTCICKDGKVYNEKLATCQAVSTTSMVLTNPWIIIGIVIASIVLFIILIALIRYFCYTRPKEKANLQQEGVSIKSTKKPKSYYEYRIQYDNPDSAQRLSKKNLPSTLTNI